jgi:UDPglucose 6-dehydrogenase
MLQTGVYGSGFLGTVISACLADFGTPVFCCDEDAARLLTLAQGSAPFHEKNLEEVIRRNVRTSRLVYSTEIEKLVPHARVLFYAADTEEQLKSDCLRLARLMSKDALLVLVTPVPVGTASQVEQMLKDEKLAVTVVSQPVSLTGGCAVEDFNWPDRIILGTNSQAAVKALKQTYHPLVMRGVPVVVTNHETAELVRQAATAFLATKISFINELSGICEHVKADAVHLALALGLDKRIAPRCLQPGAGFGGPFAESDMDALAHIAEENGVELKVLNAAREVNHGLSERLVEKIARAVHSVSGKEVGILGLAFKPNTNSVAGSSAVRLARSLISQGASVRAYDPVAIPEAQAELSGRVRYCESAYAAAEGVDALVVGTAWPEFRNLDFERIFKLLKHPVIVDTKNLLDSAHLRRIGFEYVGVGRQ